ncbi:hypothetical protein [Microcoleus sp. herbarium14]|uniref:hypothetical protein n=1 Tax=Microcoleus sp. herbarium14 TaxID=3055439 RepID=UPI002FD04575
MAFYTCIVEYFVRPFNFKSSIQLGTTAVAYRIYDTFDPKNYRFRSWINQVQPKFDFFVPEYQFRPGQKPAPRLEKWCKSQNCCVHRLGFNDVRKVNFNCFSLDNWYIFNRDFLGYNLDITVTYSLDIFLRSLPIDSRIIVNEPYSLFADRRSFLSFTQWGFGFGVQTSSIEV